jgi:hypothetical protein
MPGTRTAPTVDGSPVYLTVGLTFYDWTGDQRTDSYQIDADSTDVEIEAFCAAVVPLSNGTLWRISVGQVYNGVGDKNDAIEEVWENVKDNVVFLMKKTDNTAEDFFIPSPVNAMMLENSEQIDPAYGPTATFLAAVLPMRATFSWISARMSHRKQIGKKINL